MLFLYWFSQILLTALSGHAPICILVLPGVFWGAVGVVVDRNCGSAFIEVSSTLLV